MSKVDVFSRQRPSNDSRGHKRLSNLFSRIKSALICGSKRSYRQETRKLEIASYTERSSHVDDRFYSALIEEGLLKGDTFFIDSRARSKNVLLLHEYPVINICVGFSNDELSRKLVRYTASRDYLEYETCRVQYGINRILASQVEKEDDGLVDGIPASLWLDIYGPVIQSVLVLKAQMRNRSILTKRRKNRLIPPPDYQPPIIGDSRLNLVHVIIGPYQQRQERHRMVMVRRLGELGERPLLPFRPIIALDELPIYSETPFRPRNRALLPWTMATPGARRDANDEEITERTHADGQIIFDLYNLLRIHADVPLLNG